MEKILYTDNNGNKIEGEKLLPCPFCGYIPDLLFIGNSATKSRKILIKCTNSSCRVETTSASIRNDTQWLLSVSINVWNKRVNTKL